MTASGDFIPKDIDLDEEPTYPTVFGITLTPIISGVLIAVVGIGLAGWLLTSLVQPEWEKNQDLEAKVKQKQDQVNQQANLQKQINAAKAQLEQAKQQNNQVLALFSNARALDTLLLDLNQLIDRNNAGVTTATRAKLNTCPGWVRDQYTDISSAQQFEKQIGPLVANAKLNKFTPEAKTSGIVADGSLGGQLNNKLKRQVVNVEFTGNFNQTQAIFRTIERLQSLLLLRNLQVVVGTGGQGGQAGAQSLYERSSDGTVRFLTNCQPDNVLTTSFQLEALLPLTPEERAAANPAPKPSPGASPGASPAPSPAK